MLFKRRYKKRRSFLGRLARSFLAIVILSSLVLGISFVVKEVSTLDAQKFAFYTRPLFSRIGVSEDKVGQVAGMFIKRVGEVDVKMNDSNKSGDDETDSGSIGREAVKSVTISDEAVVGLALLADSENDFDNLRKALGIVKDLGVDYVVFLGDFTGWGDEDSLVEAKGIMDESGLEYYAIPGDHDLAEAVQQGDLSGLGNFKKVFGNNFHTVVIGGIKIVVLDNSANYSLIASGLMDWFSEEVGNADFVILSQPVYHPTNNRIMGVVDGVEVSTVRQQAERLHTIVKASPVKAVIAADQHYFSRNPDPEKANLEHIVIGALVSNNENFRNLQTPRFAVLTVMGDGSYDVEEVVLD